MDNITILLIILLILLIAIFSIYLVVIKGPFTLTLRSAIDNMSAGMYIRTIDRRGKRYNVFNSMAKLFYKAESVLDSIFWDQEEEDKYDEMTIRQDLPICFEKHICDDQGNTIRWLDVAKYKNQKRNGGYLIITTLIDITHRKNSEKQLIERNQKIMLALKTSKMIAWDYDVNMRTFYSENETINGSFDIFYFSEQDYYNAAHPDDVVMMKQYVKLMNNGVDTSFSFNARIRKPQDLNWIYTCISGTPLIKDEAGRVLKYTGFRSDQSDLVRAKHKVNDINNLLTTVINKIPCIMFLKDVEDEFRYLLVNEYFCNTYRISRKELIGKTDFEIFDKETANKIRQYEQSIVDGMATHTLDESITLNGISGIWQTTKNAFVSVDGRKMLLAIAVDLRERIHIQEELEDAKRRAELANKLKSAFLANMSHEIRTPLNAIVGFSDLMMEATSKEDQNEFRQIIALNNELLLKLIEDILDLSKIESGAIDFHRTKFDLVSYFSEISESMRIRIKNPEVNFVSVNIYDRCIVSLDKNRLMQIITNFVSNSIKYTQKGEIEMGYQYVEGGIRFYVKDTGIGIEEEKKSVVFNRFEKADSFVQGIGLGLSICKAIAEATGGEIGFESTYGEGSTFWYIARTEIEEGLDDNDILVDNKSNYIPSKSLDRMNLKVLVAEDNMSNYMLIEYILKGFNITHVQNGKDAVEMLRTNEMDIVLMDINMPIMNGLDAISSIREFNQEIPIIAISANAFKSDINEAIHAGCNAFITKPIRQAELMNSIERLLVADASC